MSVFLTDDGCWTRQPPNKAGPCKRWRPSALWAFSHLADQVSGKPITRAATANSRVDLRAGTHLAVTGTSVANRAVLNCDSGADKPGAGDFTVIHRFVLRSSTGYLSVGRWNTGGTPSSCDWFLGAGNQFGSSGTTSDFLVAVGSAPPYTASVAGGWAVGFEYILVGRRRGTTILVDRYNEDGTILSASTTNAGITTINSNSARSLKLGEIDAGATYNAALDSSLVALFPYALTDADLRDLLPNTWALFAPDDDIIWIPGGAGGAAELAGAAIAQASASAALTTSISLAGAALSVATAAGSLTTQISLAGSATAVAGASGELTAQITVAGAAVAEAVAAAGLTTAIALAGAASAEATATGDLTAGTGGLEGAAAAQASVVATLTTSIILTGAAAALAGGAGTLTTSIPLTAAALAQAIAAGSLSTSIRLAGAAAATATATGDLTGGTATAVVHGSSSGIDRASRSSSDRPSRSSTVRPGRSSAGRTARR